MAPRGLTDVEIMEKFVETTEMISEMRIATARIETKVDALVAAQARCQNHAERLNEVEITTGKLGQNFRAGAWIVGTVLALIGTLATVAAWFKGSA